MTQSSPASGVPFAPLKIPAGGGAAAPPLEDSTAGGGAMCPSCILYRVRVNSILTLHKLSTESGVTRTNPGYSE